MDNRRISLISGLWLTCLGTAELITLMLFGMPFLGGGILDNKLFAFFYIAIITIPGLLLFVPQLRTLVLKIGHGDTYVQQLELRLFTAGMLSGIFFPLALYMAVWWSEGAELARLLLVPFVFALIFFTLCFQVILAQTSAVRDPVAMTIPTVMPIQDGPLSLAPIQFTINYPDTPGTRPALRRIQARVAGDREFHSALRGLIPPGVWDDLDKADIIGDEDQHIALRCSGALSLVKAKSTLTRVALGEQLPNITRDAIQRALDKEFHMGQPQQADKWPVSDGHATDTAYTTASLSQQGNKWLVSARAKATSLHKFFLMGPAPEFNLTPLSFRFSPRIEERVQKAFQMRSAVEQSIMATRNKLLITAWENAWLALRESNAVTPDDLPMLMQFLKCAALADSTVTSTPTSHSTDSQRRATFAGDPPPAAPILSAEEGFANRRANESPSSMQALTPEEFAEMWRIHVGEAVSFHDEYLASRVRRFILEWPLMFIQSDAPVEDHDVVAAFTNPENYGLTIHDSITPEIIAEFIEENGVQVLTRKE